MAQQKQLEGHDISLSKYQIDLEPGEKIFEVVPKHWGRVLLPMVGMGILGFINLATLFSSIFFDFLDGPIGIIFPIMIGLIYLALILFVLSELYSLRRSGLVITDQRIINHDQLSFLTERVKSMRYDELENVEGELSPGLGTILNFGKLIVRSATGMDEEFHALPDPTELAQRLAQYYNEKSKVGELPQQQAQQANSDKPMSQPQESSEAFESQESVSEKQPTILLIAHLPIDKAGEIVQTIPAQKEPTITPIENSEEVKVEAVVNATESQKIAEKMKRYGASEVFSSPVKMLE